MRTMTLPVVLFSLLLLVGCAAVHEGVYVNQMVDFAALQKVAVMPLQNFSERDEGAERVRDTFMSMLLATEAVYVLPAGEVARGISRAGIRSPATPAAEEIKSLKSILGVDAVVTGSLREYGAVRSGSSSANIVSLSIQLIEAETGAVIWSGSSTKGGITVTDRLFGGGGRPMNDVTVEVVNDLLDKLFQ
ncbi:MAG: DUF799 family lipoprotein [Deltaproteobacteria bacterium]|nr:DUF799 family lipoprotein [Candidatus Anaeroferrophillus wilburensis]MBN2888001.1 DUF799 family lipoprotein [Deltaproteobacteria bacterium]